MYIYMYMYICIYIYEWLCINLYNNHHQPNLGVLQSWPILTSQPAVWGATRFVSEPTIHASWKLLPNECIEEEPQAGHLDVAMWNLPWSFWNWILEVWWHFGRRFRRFFDMFKTMLLEWPNFLSVAKTLFFRVSASAQIISVLCGFRSAASGVTLEVWVWVSVWVPVGIRCSLVAVTLSYHLCDWI